MNEDSDYVEIVRLNDRLIKLEAEAEKWRRAYLDEPSTSREREFIMHKALKTIRDASYHRMDLRSIAGDALRAAAGVGKPIPSMAKKKKGGKGKKC